MCMRKLTEDEIIAVLLMWPSGPQGNDWFHVGNGHFIRSGALTPEGRASWDRANGDPDCFFTPWANAVLKEDNATVELEGPGGVTFTSRFSVKFPLVCL